jgi:hypothetical protein
MSFNDDMALTFRTVASGPASNWPAYAAVAGMLVMIGGMIAMMWFLSSRPTSDLTAWLCGGASVAGLALWRNMLPVAIARQRKP